jgi:hypothetical protein
MRWVLIVAVACGSTCASGRSSNRVASPAPPSHAEVFRRLRTSNIALPTAGCDGAFPLGTAVDVVVTGLSSTGPMTADTICHARAVGWRCRLTLTARRTPTCDDGGTEERCWVTTLTYTYEVDLDRDGEIEPPSVRCTATQR